MNLDILGVGACPHKPDILEECCRTAIYAQLISNLYIAAKIRFCTMKLLTKQEQLTEGLTDSDHESWDERSSAGKAEELEVQELAEVADEVLKGVTRLMHENVDFLQNRIGGNKKLQKIKDLVDELQVDLVATNEHKMRLGHKLNRNGISQMLNGGEIEIRSAMGGNAYEKGGSKVQRGGTGMLLYGNLIDQYDFEASGKNATGLGRWVHMVLQGEDGIKIRFVCGYNP